MEGMLYVSHIAQFLECLPNQSSSDFVEGKRSYKRMFFTMSLDIRFFNSGVSNSAPEVFPGGLYQVGPFLVTLQSICERRGGRRPQAQHWVGQSWVRIGRRWWRNWKRTALTLPMPSFPPHLLVAQAEVGCPGSGWDFRVQKTYHGLICVLLELDQADSGHILHIHISVGAFWRITI